ncbi:MAG: DUF1801 domain-containing protein [Paracoccaceae bacterium]
MSQQEGHEVYLANLPDDQRQELTRLRALIRSILPEAEEVISYNMPAFRQKKVVVGIAAFKHNCGLYPFSGSIIPKLADRLGSYKASKSGVLFTPAHPLPDDLVRAIIAARLAEIG